MLELNLLDINGVGEATKQKLINAGINNPLELAVYPPREVADLAKLTIEKAAELAENARKLLIEKGLIEESFIEAEKVLERRQKIGRISTGSTSLDDLLLGGIETQAITELYGEFGSSKTQLCHMLCVMVQLPKEQGGLEGGALYLDTEQTFRPERIFQIAQARNLNPSKILKNIVYCQVYNSSHLEILLKEMGSIIKKNNIKLLIVDSIISHYRAEYLGRGELSERQQKLNEIMHRILRLAVIHNLAAIITNQVQGQPDIFFGDPIKPTGGNIIGHNATYRVYLRKIYGKNTTLRMAKMIDSPYHPNSECMFCVTEKGIEDMKDAEKMRFAEVRGA